MALAKLEAEFPNFSELEFIHGMRNRTKQLVAVMDGELRKEQVNHAAKNQLD